MKLEPSPEVFARTYVEGAPQLVWTRLVDDLETPVSAYLKIARGGDYAFLFESVEGGAWRGRYSILAMSPDLVWRCRDGAAEIARGAGIAQGAFEPCADDALAALRDLVAASRLELPSDLPPMAAGLFGVVGYDMARLAERLPRANPDPLDLPDAVLIRPSLVAIFDAVGQEIILVTTVRPDEATAAEALAQARSRLEDVAARLSAPLSSQRGVTEPGAPHVFSSPLDRGAYGAVVERAKSYIRAGDVFQVVPSHRFQTPFTGQPFALYRSLRRANPSPFLFFLNLPGFQLVGSSPEILVRLRGGKVTIRPIAGTRPRGATPEEDQRLERDLLADEKERAEHLMLLDLGRNDVSRVTMMGAAGRNQPSAPAGARRPARVRVTESFLIERYSHVMHIVSNVEGDAPDGVDPVDVLMAALPAGTLSGAPKIRAMEIIDELERVKRGVAYGGAVGYFGADGSLDTCIVLRTGLIKDGVLHVQAGGGVVADSDPAAEYEETVHKSGALRCAADEAWRFEERPA